MMPSDAPLALFDVDSRERGVGASCGLCARPRMSHLQPALDRLYAFAAERGLPIVFTTCCSGRMLAPGERPDVLHIPMDAADQGWVSQLDEYRLYYVEKPAWGDPQLNYERRAFEIFARNDNVAPLVQALGDRRWVVFGNGFDLCVDGVVQGLRRAGRSVTVLADVLVSSATGNADTMRERLEGYRREGIDTPTLAELLERAR